MPTISQILTKVFPKLRVIEENPSVTILKIDGKIGTNPFADKKNEVYTKQYTVPCIFSEQPEIVRTSSNITTEQQMYFYIQKADLENTVGELTLKDKFVFNGRRYGPVEIQLLFGLWKIKVNKE